VDRPRVIEALRGKDIVDISCGGAHSAAITSMGELYTWGKGRYGRPPPGPLSGKGNFRLYCWE
jgi:alpha-tubulin suppressor-like RCC1 family protein